MPVAKGFFAHTKFSYTAIFVHILSLGVVGGHLPLNLVAKGASHDTLLVACDAQSLLLFGMSGGRRLCRRNKWQSNSADGFACRRIVLSS
jgi:hypothetical protein